MRKTFTKRKLKGFIPLEISRSKRLPRRPLKAESGSLTGFTIIELLVAMGLFVILTAIAVASFTQALRSERRLTAMMSVDANASIALEQMAREMRTGYIFSQPGGPQSLSFISSQQNGVSVAYALGGGAITKDGSPITSGNVRISNLKFLVTQENNCDPWRITIAMTVGQASVSDTSNDVPIQTTVSSRILPREVPFKYKTASIMNCK